MAAPRICIIGLGLIGGSLALALRRARPSLHLIGVDANAETRALALAARAVDEASGLTQAPLDDCDAVVLAVPAPALLELVSLVASRMREGAVLTDVCGAKESVCARGAEQRRVYFVGAHPMAGTEFRGFAAADADLFRGATVAICPPRIEPAGTEAASNGAPGDAAVIGVAGDAADAGASSSANALHFVRGLWRAAGAGKLLEVEPELHDRAVTWASHLPYLAAAAVVRSLGQAGAAEELARELAAGGFRDTTRLAGDATLGGAAQLNRFVPGAVRELAEGLRALAAQMEQEPERCRELLTATADERRAMKLPPKRP